MLARCQPFVYRINASGFNEQSVIDFLAHIRWNRFFCASDLDLQDLMLFVCYKYDLAIIVNIEISSCPYNDIQFLLLLQNFMSAFWETAGSRRINHSDVLDWNYKRFTVRVKIIRKSWNYNIVSESYRNVRDLRFLSMLKPNFFRFQTYYWQI